MFYLFLALMTTSWLAAYPKIFKDASTSSFDWDEDPDERKISLWVIVGLIALFTVTFLMAFFHFEQLNTYSLMWVPSDPYPFKGVKITYPFLSTAETASGGLWAFTVDVFSTLFAVVTGEESLKSLFSVLWKAYGHLEGADRIPFALQPFWLVGVGFWATEHVIAGQNPPIFALNVFLCGVLMGFASAKSGSAVTMYIIHALYNLTVLFAVLLSGGYGLVLSLH